MAKKIILPHKMIRDKTAFVKSVNTKIANTPTKYGLPNWKKPFINATKTAPGQSISEALKEKMKAGMEKLGSMSENTGINGGSKVNTNEIEPTESAPNPAPEKSNYNWKIIVPVIVVIAVAGYFMFRNN